MNKAIFKKIKRGHMASIPQKEIIKTMVELSTGGFKLLMYYYSRSDGFRFSDDKIARAIGSSERQVKKFRKELTEKKYLLIQKGEVDVYFVGEYAVEEFLHPKKTNEEVEKTDPKVFK